MKVDNDKVLVQDQDTGYPVSIVISDEDVSNRSAAYLAALLGMPLETVAAYDVGVGIKEKEVEVEKSESGNDAEKLAKLINRGEANDHDVDLTLEGAGALRVCFDSTQVANLLNQPASPPTPVLTDSLSIFIAN